LPTQSGSGSFPGSPTVSHHLKKLREAGLIISERRGTWVYCRVAPGVLPAMARMLAPID
jgi:ArsR family transcriptional regulator